MLPAVLNFLHHLIAPFQPHNLHNSTFSCKWIKHFIIIIIIIIIMNQRYVEWWVSIPGVATAVNNWCRDIVNIPSCWTEHNWMYIYSDWFIVVWTYSILNWQRNQLEKPLASSTCPSHLIHCYDYKLRIENRQSLLNSCHHVLFKHPTLLMQLYAECRRPDVEAPLICWSKGACFAMVW